MTSTIFHVMISAVGDLNNSYEYKYLVEIEEYLKWNTLKRLKIFKNFPISSLYY